MSTRAGEDGPEGTGARWQPYRLLLLLCAVGAAVWALVGMWYVFDGVALLGEPDEYRLEVGGRQFYWAGGALIGAVVAALSLRGRRSGRRLFVAAGLLLVSVALSLVGWEARDDALHPNTAGAVRAFRAPSGAQLVQQDLGGRFSTRIWQSKRPLADVCREMEREFERWASNVQPVWNKYDPCTFHGDRGDFSTSLIVDDAARLRRIVGEGALDPDRGAVGVRLVVRAG